MVNEKRIHFLYALILAIVCSIFFFSNRNPSKEYDRTINADMKSYYAYLPAVFIYGDLQYNFVSEYESRYYPADRSQYKDFRLETSNGRVVNKTYPGLAILLLPFFLLAHGLTLLTGGEADGYSLLYQYALVLAVWTYFIAACYCCLQILKNIGFRLWTRLLALTLICFGTNLFYYVAFDFTVSHIFNFFLVSLFFLCFQTYFSNKTSRHLYVAIAVLVLMVVVRPTNLLVALMAPLTLSEPAQIFTKLRRLVSWKDILRICAIGFSILLIPFTLFMIQIGKPFAYGYGKEGFDFLHPHLFDFLISYKKGWLLYSPMLLLTLLSFVFWFRKKTSQAILALGFITLMVYIYSSWWAWNFGGGFGERVMIDYSILYMIALCYMTDALKNKAVRLGVLSVFVLFSLLSVFQSWQTFHGILPGARVTEDIYWENFLSTKRKARYYFEEEKLIFSDIYPTDFESPNGLKNDWLITDYDAHSGTKSAFLGDGVEFGVTRSIDVRARHLQGKSHFRIGLYVKAVEPVQTTSMVVAIEQNGKLLQYNAFGLKEYAEPGEWVFVEFGAQIQIHSDSSAVLTVYPWDPGKQDKLLVDDLQIDVMLVSED